MINPFCINRVVFTLTEFDRRQDQKHNQHVFF